MSADNWGFCPRCKDKALQEEDKLRTKIKQAYGKIPQEKYIELRDQLFNPVEVIRTLREDYGIRTDEDGSFRIVYGCHCDKCGFKFSFNHTEQLKI